MAVMGDYITPTPNMPGVTLSVEGDNRETQQSAPLEVDYSWPCEICGKPTPHELHVCAVVLRARLDTLEKRLNVIAGMQQVRFPEDNLEET